MKEKNLRSWEDFENEVEELVAQIELKKEELRKKGDPFYIPHPLFRGQSNSEWQLRTTIERIKGKVSCYKYHLVMQQICPNIESFTGERWDLPAFQESDIVPMPPEGYPYMAYLRHHHFPSPLLDWTRSHYIAAFFAFSPTGSDRNAEHIAIYAYLEHLEVGKGGWETEPKIITLGPNVRTHKRHYLQQCEYTICTMKQDDRNYYWNHEEVFLKGQDDQDILWKFTIPVSERLKVLKKLDSMNINAYSLFNDEESLLSSLAVRIFFIDDT